MFTRLWILFIGFRLVRPIMMGNRNPIIRILKPAILRDPIPVDVTWEEGEVPWDFSKPKKNEMKGNDTHAFVLKNPKNPLTPVGVLSGKFIYEIN